MTAPWIAAALRQSQLFTGVSSEHVELAARHFEPVDFADGETVYQAGETARHLFIVSRGRLKALFVEASGRERVVGFYGRGDVVGTAVIFSREYPATLEAVQDSQLLRLDVRKAIVLGQGVPQLGTNLRHLLGERIRQTVVGRTAKASHHIIGLLGAAPRSDELWRLLLERLAFGGKRICVVSLSSSSAFASAPFSAASAGVEFRSFDGSTANAAHELHHLAAEFDRVLLHLDVARTEHSSLAWLPHCDIVLLPAEAADPEAAIRNTARLTAAQPGIKRHLHLVWLLDEQHPISPLTTAQMPLATRDFKVALDGVGEFPDLRRRQGIERIARFLNGFSVGLALGGGGARGLAHLGVLRAFDAAGLTFDMIAGTSVGSLLGVSYGANFDPDFSIETYSRELTPPRAMQWLPTSDAWYLLFMFRCGKRVWERKLRKYYFDWTLEQLPVPFSTVTVDLVRGEEVVRRTGDAINSVFESINIPGLAKPICRDGMLLADGGVLNNVPASVLIDEGADVVVAVDVATRLQQRVGGNTPQTPTEQMRPPGVAGALLRTLEVQFKGLGSRAGGAIDVLIEPDGSAFDFGDFTKGVQLAAVGEAAAREAIPQIRKLISAAGCV